MPFSEKGIQRKTPPPSVCLWSVNIHSFSDFTTLRFWWLLKYVFVTLLYTYLSAPSVRSVDFCGYADYKSAFDWKMHLKVYASTRMLVRHSNSLKPPPPTLFLKSGSQELFFCTSITDNYSHVMQPLARCVEAEYKPFPTSTVFFKCHTITFVTFTLTIECNFMNALMESPCRSVHCCPHVLLSHPSPWCRLPPLQAPLSMPPWLADKKAIFFRASWHPITLNIV